MHRYRCVYCKQETTAINDRLEGHLEKCEYRIQLEKARHDALGCTVKTTLKDADELD